MPADPRTFEQLRGARPIWTHPDCAAGLQVVPSPTMMPDLWAAGENSNAMLRLRRERPRRSAAEERDELAPSHHSITSSVRASNVAA
jgi:hypothetical protein